jgi:LysM repeat protein/predicted nucleic acid-binding Zn ribbon protein
MNESPQLSPDLRPVRYCPNCGQRVAQKADTCFMCGYNLQASRQRRVSFPIGDLLLIVMVLGGAFFWWTRSGQSPDTPASASQPAAVTASPTSSVQPVAAPPPSEGTPMPLETPSPTVAMSPTATPTPIRYTVVRGDTVEKIAAKYGITVDDLMIANGLTSDLIRIDEVLVIPPAPLPRGADGRPLPTATPTPVNAIYLVVVRAGDTLESIAQRQGSSVAAIVAANDEILNADTIIRPGDQVIVPVGTVLPTLTPNVRGSPTATPVPTATPTPGPRWPAPQLMSPLDGEELAQDEVLLQWISVGQLDPEEVYVVRIMPAGIPRAEMTTVTVGTSFRVPLDWLQRYARRSANRFLWQVQIARDARAIAGQTAGLLASSPASPARLFLWYSEPPED